MEDNPTTMYRAQGALRALHELFDVFNGLPDALGRDDEEEQG